MNKCFKWKTNDQYATPKNIYNQIIEKGYKDFNSLCEEYEDSLKKQFDCNLFCNPPYSNIEPFVDYMIKHTKRGYSAIMLLPVRTGTKWFKRLYEKGVSIFYFTWIPKRDTITISASEYYSLLDIKNAWEAKNGK